MGKLRFDELAAIEANFKSNKRDTDGKVWHMKESPTTKGAIRLQHSKDDWYYKEAIKKSKIVLHFTAGVLHGDLAALTKSKVSVAFLIARDGTVYELFNPDLWAYHLGQNAAGGNTEQSRTSIGIEISNLGPLTLDKENGILKTWSGSDYCTLKQTEAYLHVPGGFRGYEFYATYTDAQYKALDSLLTNLCRKYDIPRNLPSSSDRGRLFTSAPPNGIWSHQNYRKDKFDIGPAFDFSKISGR